MEIEVAQLKVKDRTNIQNHVESANPVGMHACSIVEDLCRLSLLVFPYHVHFDD